MSKLREKIRKILLKKGTSHDRKISDTMDQVASLYDAAGVYEDDPRSPDKQDKYVQKTMGKEYLDDINKMKSKAQKHSRMSDLYFTRRSKMRGKK